MKLRPFLGGVTALVLVCQMGRATTLTPVALPSTEGTVVGTTFSPDSKRIAIIRNATEPHASEARHLIELADLETGREIARADVLDGESLYLTTVPHLVHYSPDGRYLLLATSGSDVLFMLDATNLQVVKRIDLHPEIAGRKSLSGRPPPSKRVVNLAVASNAEVFAVLTNDLQMGTNELFIGSFPSGEIVKSWSVGEGRSQSELGQISVSLSADGQRIAVSIMPLKKNTLPKNFNNLRLYKSDTGELISAIRTNVPIGPIALLSEDTVLASRIDAPSIFRKTTCSEEWSFATRSVMARFCDQGRHIINLGASTNTGLVAGFACQIHRDLEGNVFSIPGRVDVWDSKSGALITYSDEFRNGISIYQNLQFSADGSLLLAGHMVFRLVSPGNGTR